MIKTKKGELKVKGSLIEIKADLSVIVYELYHNILTENMSKEEAKEEIMDAVNRGFLEDEEIEEDVNELLEQFFEEMGELREILEKGRK